jgi:hypothetical protein
MDKPSIFRQHSGITSQVPETSDYKLVRALTMTIDGNIYIDKFIDEIFKGFSKTKDEPIREFVAFASTLTLDGNSVTIASQVYDRGFDQQKFSNVENYEEYFDTRKIQPKVERITWLGAPAIVFSYKNRNKLAKFLHGSLLINLMFWITSFSSFDCFNKFSAHREEKNPFLRGSRRETIQNINEDINPSRGLIDVNPQRGLTKYIFAFDIDETLTPHYALKEHALKMNKELRRSVIAAMKKIITSENYVWIITANNYTKREFIDKYFDNNNKTYFANSGFFFFMNNANIPNIYEKAKASFPDDPKLEKIVLTKIHSDGLKPYALYGQSLIEKDNYNSHHSTKISNFKIYLFDDHNIDNLIKNCEKFNINFVHVTDFSNNGKPVVPNLVNNLDTILKTDLGKYYTNVKIIHQRLQRTLRQVSRLVSRRTLRKTTEQDAAHLYCDRYEEIKKHCKNIKWQKNNTYKNYYLDKEKGKTGNEFDVGKFLTNFDDCIKRVQDEERDLQRYNTENETNYVQRYNEMFSYIYPWDIEGIEIGAIDNNGLKNIIKIIESERTKIKTQLIYIKENFKESIKRINTIIHVIITNPDYATLIYDYITNPEKKDLKITFTLFLLTKLILLSRCNIAQIVKDKSFDFSDDENENIKGLVGAIITIMDEPLKIFEYTYNEGQGFKMETIASLDHDKDITSIKRSSDLVLFEFKQDIKTNILNTHKSSKQLSGTIATLEYKVSDLVPQQSISASQISINLDKPDLLSEKLISASQISINLDKPDLLPQKSKKTYKTLETLKSYLSNMVTRTRKRVRHIDPRLAGKKRTRRNKKKKK